MPERVADCEVQTMPSTRLTFQPDRTVLGADGDPVEDLSAGFDHDGKFRAVTGWMEYAKAPYSDELMAGVRNSPLHSRNGANA